MKNTKNDRQKRENAMYSLFFGFAENNGSFRNKQTSFQET